MRAAVRDTARAMTQLSRTCGWCSSSTIDASLSHCTSCGGPLPALRAAPDAVALLGQAPPPAPRELPAPFRRRVLVFKNVLVIIGGIFTFLFGWTIIFGLIGLPMLYVGWTRGQKRLRALSLGTPAQGEIIEVEKDTSVRINNRSPWQIRFSYPTPAGPQEAWVHAWKRPDLRPSDPTWVLYMPDDPGHGCLWPPVQ